MGQEPRKTLETLLTTPPAPPRQIGSRPVVVYGAGQRGRRTVAHLRHEGHEVVAVIDRQATGEVDGCPIVRLDDPGVGQLARDGAVAAIAVFNPSVDPLPIHQALETAGFSAVFGAVELAQLHPGLAAYWLGSAHEMTPPPTECLWLVDRLADDASRHVLAEAIGLRRRYGPEWLRSPDVKGQYIPADVPVPRDEIRFVDGGAFDGDTIVQMVASGCTFASIAAFEPDSKNYVALRQRIGDLALPGDITLWPCGLDETARQLAFRAEGLASSGFVAGGESLVQTVSLDQAMPNARPTYVKLDIEGAESAALRGMGGLLREARPAVAVCVYHKPSDLWNIPRLIDEFLPRASVYLRYHAWNGFDLVLYAVPDERLT